MRDNSVKDPMSILVSVSQVSKAFAARPLFKNLTFAIESGERVGLIGPNGVGKSTFLRILASQISADSGNVAFQKGLRVGYLEQLPSFTEKATVLSTVMEGAFDPHAWECQTLVGEYLSRLQLDGSAGVGPETLVSELSGGWKKRVALARELVRQPDLLLLDEPTNHLDVESILWLEELLSRSSFATITITHDRLFLQRVSNRIVEINPRYAEGILSVKGSYVDYLEIQEQIFSGQEQRETSLKNTLRRETEWLRRGAKARTTKQQARIHRAGDLKNEVAELSYRNQSRSVQLDFQSSERNPKKLIEAKNLSKSFGDKKIFEGVNLVISPGVRIGLMGPNGCGKSTLIRTLLGQETPDTGSVARADQLSVAYFEQNRESLDPTKTVLRTLCPQGDHVSFRGKSTHIRGYLDRFLFTQGQMEMAVGKLSGGEQSRLLVARLMLQEANLLILDEPTNDLDMNTLKILEDCLTDFSGAILLVTHDRYFLDQVATQILAFGRNGKVVPMVGLDQWEQWHSDEEALVKAENNSTAFQKTSVTFSEPAAAKKKKLSFKEQREYDSMEKLIHETEAELGRLETESSSPALATNAIRLNEITQAMSDLHLKIEQLYTRWAQLETKGS